ncbi:MAG: bacillithiol biosynthesis cysteine-adding enzyme BshC [Cyclonatronaceae bacterium]
MDIEQQDIRNLPFSRLFRDYLKGSDNLAPFYSRKHSWEELTEAVRAFKFHGDRKKTAQVIADFNAPFLDDNSRIEELAGILADENTVTVTTGQQLSLFGGPLYTVFKTISVIYFAKKLSQETGRRVIPVFWLADEDHDYEEISEIALPAGGKMKKMELPCSTPERHAAGSILIDKEFESFRRQVFDALQETDFHEHVTSLINEAYTPGRTLKDAFALLLSRLFVGHDLVFAGSHFTEAKKLASGCMRKAIGQVDVIREALDEQSRKLQDHYHQQVQITDSLFFWHDDEQGRIRLRHENGSWQIGSGPSMTTKELMTRLDEEPERFSPNVFLRPLIQDTLLPNAAYVAGPAEIAYYGQMKPVYEIMGMEMPFIAARLSATLVEPNIQRFVIELPFSFSDYSGRLEDLEQHYLRKHGAPDLDDQFEDWKKKVEELTGEITEKLAITDPGLQKHAQAITREHVKAIDKYKKKTVNRLRESEEVQLNRIRKVKTALFPADKLQEREIASVYFMNKFGTDIWDRILAQLDDGNGRTPLFTRHRIIKL